MAVKVRETIRLIEADGWVRLRSTGGYRQYKHPTKPGRVTVPGQMSDTLTRKTWASIRAQAGL